MYDHISVLCTANTRPHYLRPTIRSWRNARGIMGTHEFVLALGRDGDIARQRAVAAGSHGLVTEILMDRDRPNVGKMHASILDAGKRAFGRPGCDFVIFAEEDVLVSTDIMEYFSWAYSNFRSNERVLLVNAHSVGGQGWDQHEPADDALADQWSVTLRPYFNAWVWGTWADRWPFLATHWDDGRNITASRQGYDWRIQSHMDNFGFWAATPSASRSQCIGQEGGVYSTGKTWSFSQAASFRLHRDPDFYTLEPPREGESPGGSSAFSF